MDESLWLEKKNIVGMSKESSLITQNREANTGNVG